MNCKNCEKEFKPRANQLYCTGKCAEEYHKKIYDTTICLYPGAVNGITSGAISELLCASDLMKKGYEVFRSLSPACSCDLIALKGKKLLRIEVRAAYVSVKDGEAKICKSTHAKDKGRQDHFAWVTKQEIFYDPPLEQV